LEIEFANDAAPTTNTANVGIISGTSFGTSIGGVPASAGFAKVDC
jgi:hypothetical protein